MNRQLAIALAYGVGFGCGPSAVRTLAESTTETISPAGGETKSADGLLTISFPAGAVATPTEVTIVTDRTRTMDGLVSPIYRVSPRGLSFDAPIALELDVHAVEAPRIRAMIFGA